MSDEQLFISLDFPSKGGFNVQFPHGANLGSMMLVSSDVIISLSFSQKTSIKIPGSTLETPGPVKRVLLNGTLIPIPGVHPISTITFPMGGIVRMPGASMDPLPGEGDPRDVEIMVDGPEASIDPPPPGGES
jgi:hypothetical protein